MALFRVDYTGRGELSDRQQKLGQMLSRLTRISEEYNVAVFITSLSHFLHRIDISALTLLALDHQIKSKPTPALPLFS